MDGELLQKWLTENRMKAPELAKNLSMTKQAIYHNLKLEKLDDGFKLKLRNIGIDIFAEKENGLDLSRLAPLAQKYIQVLEEKNKLLEKLVASYEAQIRQLEKNG